MANPFADKSNLVVVTPKELTGLARIMDKQLEKGTFPKFSEIKPHAIQLIGKKIVILGNPPSKSNCYRIVTFRSKDPLKTGYSTLAKTPALKQYEKDFAKQWVNKGMIAGDFKFEMDVYFPTKRSDLDNSLKCVLDCLQPADKRRPFGVGAIENDNMAQDIHIRKHIDKMNPRIEFVIIPINQ